MGLFSSKGKECWICSRKTTDENGMFLNSNDLTSIFTDVFTEFPADKELKDYCLCVVCAGILKFTSQDSVAARIKIEEASESLKKKFGSAKSKLSDRFKKSE